MPHKYGGSDAAAWLATEATTYSKHWFTTSKRCLEYEVITKEEKYPMGKGALELLTVMRC